jgi:stage V sporulation protein R
LPQNQSLSPDETEARFPSEPQENVLCFIETHVPMLETWQREIVRIVRKLSQYFHPQRQTQVMNEGWACFWH